MNHAVLRIAICGTIALCLTIGAEAANKPKASPQATVAVQEILEAEIQSANESVDRRDALKPISRPDADPNPVWWQAGYVRSGKQWRPFEEDLAEGEHAKLLDEYQVQRGELSDQPHGQWTLATWCRKNGLPDQERVHLLRVLTERDPTVKTALVYERLGCHKIGDGWVSPQERRETAELKSEIEQSHKRWDHKLKTIVEHLEGAPKARAAGEKQLTELTHPSAVPAIVDALCLSNRSLAAYGVRTLGQIPEYQASRALAGMAVFSTWKTVRTSAIGILKQRKLEHFAPDLLLLLSNPIHIRLDPNAQGRPGEPGMRINWDYVWVEETQDSIRVGLGRLLPAILPTSTGQIASIRHPSLRGLYIASKPNHDIESALARVQLEEQAKGLDFTTEKVNESRLETNEHVGRVLSECTDLPFSNEPKVWWDWWSTYSSVASPSQKNVVIVDERKSLDVKIIQISCLVAGTPVWTERGSMAIEQILPGDRVLSKDVSSGELSYKPVLQTTVREPTPVQTFKVGDDTIRSSLGHHFWVSGDGWTKLRELLPEQPLHTATGMQRIISIEDEGRIEKVYNLVVADFHTYFIGKAMVLSHDVTTPSLTNVKVPGLAVK